MDYVTSNTTLSTLAVDIAAASHPPLLSYSDALYWWAACPFVICELLYFVPALVFALCDFCLSPAVLASTKLQPSRLPTHSTASVAAYKQAFVTSISNHCFGSIPSLLVFALLARQLRLPLSWRAVSWLQLLYQACVLLCVEEVLFYYVHRALHLPLLFRSVHSVHHSFTAPVAVAATHCHLVEHVACNLLPMLAGALLSRCCWSLYLLWCAVGCANTVCVHSGYVWWPLSAANHDRHHHTNKCAFGVLGVLDWLHGTRYVDLRADTKSA